MDRTAERLNAARKALASLRALPLREDAGDVVRDAAIQRFEHSLETIWKAAQILIREREGIDVASPKAAVRASARTGWIGEEVARGLLEAVDDRNLTVHTYNEALAREIFARLPRHADNLAAWLDALSRVAAGRGDDP